MAIAPWQKHLKSEHIYPRNVDAERLFVRHGLRDRKISSPNNEVFETMTSALSAVVNNPKWLLKPQEWLQQEFK
ncbi:hypothetical protein [Nostoc sp.]|uniref:hypothetical protein n=1 Tax=Nostoc sp. TaxID=1180 RepID=UPI002FFBE59A